MGKQKVKARLRQVETFELACTVRNTDDIRRQQMTANRAHVMLAVSQYLSPES